MICLFLTTSFILLNMKSDDDDFGEDSMGEVVFETPVSHEDFFAEF